MHSIHIRKENTWTVVQNYSDDINRHVQSLNVLVKNYFSFRNAGINYKHLSTVLYLSTNKLHYVLFFLKLLKVISYFSLEQRFDQYTTNSSAAHTPSEEVVPKPWHIALDAEKPVEVTEQWKIKSTNELQFEAEYLAGINEFAIL